MSKIAIVDLGCSKIDLILAHVLPTGNFTVFEEMSETVKIVNDFDGEGLLRIARSNEALTILKMYKMVCEVNKIDDIIAIGSHSLKNLKNYRSFLDEIYNVCGFKFRILTQEEELNALYNGVKRMITDEQIRAYYPDRATARSEKFTKSARLEELLELF